MFVHNGYQHIASNVLVQVNIYKFTFIIKSNDFQLAIGPSLERMHGWWRVMLIYLAGGMAGSLSAALAYPTYFGCGASTGVFALLTAHFSNALFNWHKIKFTNYQILGFILFAMYSLVDSAVGIYRYDKSFLIRGKDIKKLFFRDNNGPTQGLGQVQVSHVGHLTGAVVGLLLGNVLLGLRNLSIYKTWMKPIWWFSLRMFLVFFIGMIFINIFYCRNLEDEIAEKFLMFDIDGDGIINEDELSITMSNHGEPIDDSDIMEIFPAFDLDGDGEIDLQEFQILFLFFSNMENDIMF